MYSTFFKWMPTPVRPTGAETPAAPPNVRPDCEPRLQPQGWEGEKMGESKAGSSLAVSQGLLLQFMLSPFCKAFDPISGVSTLLPRK